MIVEVFDSDYDEYQESLVKADQEAVEDETLIKDSLDCDLYNKSNCCTVPMLDEVDMCTDCKEYCSSCCLDCDIFSICINNNKRTE
jgi:hypothetical protein